MFTLSGSIEKEMHFQIQPMNVCVLGAKSSSAVTKLTLVLYYIFNFYTTSAISDHSGFLHTGVQGTRCSTYPVDMNYVFRNEQIKGIIHLLCSSFTYPYRRLMPDSA
jgi:hypothetical protein